MVTESARSSPATFGASRSDSFAAPPYAASTCSHRPSRRQVGELGQRVDRAGVGRCRRRRDREGSRPRPCPRDGLATPSARRRNRSSAGHDQRLARESQLVERACDREVRLVGGVDADALERRPARRVIRPEPPELDVADERHGHEVGHHAARCEQPEAAFSVADQVAQPAHDLLLDERARRTGVPDVDALGDTGRAARRRST